MEKKSLVQYKTVEENETALVVGSGGMEVFSTPMLVAFMENTAYLLAEDQLLAEETTVGVSIETKHLKANLVGDEISCHAKIEEVDGKKIHYSIEVLHKEKAVGVCKHTRFIVNKEKFLKKLKNK